MTTYTMKRIQPIVVSEPGRRDIVPYHPLGPATSSQTQNADFSHQFPNDQVGAIHQYFSDHPSKLRELSAYLYNMSLEFQNPRLKRRGPWQQMKNFIQFSIVPLSHILYPALLYRPSLSGPLNMDGVRQGQYLKEFEKETKIGQGGYATVYKAFHKVDKQFYAIKKICFNLYRKEKLYRKHGEVRCLAALSHANVVCYKTCWMEIQEGPTLLNNDSNCCTESTDETSLVSISSTTTAVSGNQGILYIQMELCDETLEDWLTRRNEEACKRKGFKHSDAVKGILIFKQIVKGVQYLHSRGKIHRDLKPMNILMKDGKPKLADFGLAAELCETQPGKCYASAAMGTPLYSAPEQQQNKKCTIKTDMHAVGVILLKLIYPFTTESELCYCLPALKKSITAEQYIYVQPKVATLAMTLLHETPENRPTADQVLRSDVFVTKRVLTRTISKSKREIHQVKRKAKMTKLQDEVMIGIKDSEIYHLKRNEIFYKMKIEAYEQEIASLKETIRKLSS